MNPFREGNESKEFELEFITKMLGTVPKDPDVYAKHIVETGKRLNKNTEKTDADIEAETETVEEVEEKGWTGFHRNGSGIFIYEYMVKGFLKSAYEIAFKKKLVKKVVAVGRMIDKTVIIDPRRIHFIDKQTADGYIERPLRGMTMRGERITVVRSDYVKGGTKIKFNIEIIKNYATKNSTAIDMEMIELLLRYGEIVGLGQWRGSGGYGRFIS
jgi:hypothetical protein